MHKALISAKNTVKIAKKSNLNAAQRKALSGAEEMIAFLQEKEAKGLALTSQDVKFLKALEEFILGMVKDSSITKPLMES